jgi:hypothetical protein
MTVASGIAVINAKARARTTKIFFMATSVVSATGAAAIRKGLLRVHDSRRGGEESEAEGEEQQYLLHGNLPPCQQPLLPQSARA